MPADFPDPNGNSRPQGSFNGLEQFSGDLIETVMGLDREVFLEKALPGKEHQMDDERKSSKAGERAAEGLREATAKEEAKTESKTGHDLAKGADRFENALKAPMEKAQKKNKKGDAYSRLGD
jgi:hypothetical protein